MISHICVLSCLPQASLSYRVWCQTKSQGEAVCKYGTLKNALDAMNRQLDLHNALNTMNQLLDVHNALSAMNRKLDLLRYQQSQHCVQADLGVSVQHSPCCSRNNTLARDIQSSNANNIFFTPFRTQESGVFCMAAQSAKTASVNTCSLLTARLAASTLYPFSVLFPLSIRRV